MSRPMIRARNAPVCGRIDRAAITVTFPARGMGWPGRVLAPNQLPTNPPHPTPHTSTTTMYRQSPHVRFNPTALVVCGETSLIPRVGSNTAMHLGKTDSEFPHENSP